MNFIEAVRSLRNGECKGIKRQSCVQVYRLNGSFIKLLGRDDEFDISNTAWFLADDWQMVDPIPQTETVEVKRWMHIHNSHIATDKPIYNLSDWIELTGQYQREILRNVKRREPVFGFEGHFAGGGNIPANAKIFAEWEA